MNAQRSLFRVCVLAGAIALGGCLISEKPLLDARNGRGKPLAAGQYEACEYDDNGGEPDCKLMDVSRDIGALYTFRVADEDDTTLARFRRIGRGFWLAQLNGEEDEDYFYFIGEEAADGFTMAMVVCEDIPGDVRAKYVKSGEMEVDDNATTCTVTTLRAATASAKAYRAATAPESRSRIVYRKVSGAAE